MHVRVNGEDRDLAGQPSVEDLLRAVGAEPSRVAVLVNDAVVPRVERAAHRLADGDRVEVVTFLAGG